jgi:hypothetical protein
MSTLYITEYVGMAEVGRFAPASGVAHFGQEPGTDQAPITIGATHAESAAFGTNTKLIRVHTDVVCSILISAAGTAATTSNKRLAANQTEYFGVSAGQKLSVIANT